MSKETFYFKHDYNARADRKLVNVMIKYGVSGIGVYWCIVEMLYEECGYLPLEYERIAFELRTDKNVIQSMVNDFDLFKNDGEKFWSESVLERMNERMDKSEKARQSVTKRWEKYERNTNVIPPKKKRNTRRGEEKKGEKKRREFVPPLIDDVKKYFDENGYNETSAIKAFNYYNVAEWHDSLGHKIKNWKQKMQSVWFKDENKKQVSAAPQIKMLPKI